MSWLPPPEDLGHSPSTAIKACFVLRPAYIDIEVSSVRTELLKASERLRFIV